MNRFTKEELAEGKTVDAIIQVGQYFFYGCASYSKDEFPEGAPDEVVIGFLADKAYEASTWMKLVSTDDIGQVRKFF